MAGHSRLDPTDPHLISIPEAARRLGFSRDHTYRLAKTGQLPGATRIGKDWRVSVKRLDDYLEAVPSDMGIGTESAILTQSKKAQGETNERLDRLAVLTGEHLAEQKRTNQLLEQLLAQRSPS